MQYGISTHLFHDWRLDRAHLSEIAAHGFEAVELFATRTHFDYHDDRAMTTLGRWLRETGLRLHSVHAPIAAGLTSGRWVTPFSTAISDQNRRREAVLEATAALNVARHIPYRHLILHLGVPGTAAPDTGDNRPDMAIRSLEELQAAAAPLDVRIAVEVIPNDLSGADALVTLLEGDRDLPDVGICLDFGHAFLMGDVVDAVETVSGHMVTTHVHDNGGRNDEHLVPFDGRLDWSSALIAVQKVGYEGVCMFEVANGGRPPREVLERTRRARERFETLLAL